MSEQEVLSVTDRTVLNPAAGRASAFRTLRGRPGDGKCWAARVWLDASQPGGLYRSFLRTRDDGRIVLIRDVEMGDMIEFAEKRPVYKANPDADVRIYFKVMKVTADELGGEIVQKSAAQGWADYKQARAAAQAAAEQARRALWAEESAARDAARQAWRAQLAEKAAACAAAGTKP